LQLVSITLECHVGRAVGADGALYRYFGELAVSKVQIVGDNADKKLDPPGRSS
jgi:hypothetical protein